ncbi:hypothetical protein F5148DRAFT_532214 [Russula earlei]|uniref:Uncharacterized protein n=1 Tax=Russula earlei TaxID=71964 RepID=A0ACC0TWM9_9AGAM|nr:hypothetical protein F5148DRAFT_532214 [Russula earlei]
MATHPPGQPTRVFRIAPSFLMPHHHIHWHDDYAKHCKRMIYGPSRLVWFAVGSLATWAWMRHHRECHDRPGRCPPRLEHHHDRGSHARWERVPDDTVSSEPSPPPPLPPTDYAEWRQQQRQATTPFTRGWGPTRQSGARFDARVAPPPPPSLNGESASAGADGQPEPPADGPAPFSVDVDPERLRQMGRNAEETVSRTVFLDGGKERKRK